LGILGERYKRQYLNSFNAEDLKRALKYYAEALKIAEEKQDHNQIYYHAINLAFLNLLQEDKQTMKKYAECAFKATEKDPFPSLWRMATLGEAFLYKGDFEKSKEYYAKAASMAGLREKISIHTNAYNAYISLMQTDNPNDSFIKFLKLQFLT